MCNHTNLRAFGPADEVVLVIAVNPQVLMAFSLNNLSSCHTYYMLSSRCQGGVNVPTLKHYFTAARENEPKAIKVLDGLPAKMPPNDAIADLAIPLSIAAVSMQNAC
jgi:hypothetical protein